MLDSERVLLQRFASTGDAEAFSEIVRRHAGMVYGASLIAKIPVSRIPATSYHLFRQESSPVPLFVSRGNKQKLRRISQKRHNGNKSVTQTRYKFDVLRLFSLVLMYFAELSKKNETNPRFLNLNIIGRACSMTDNVNYLELVEQAQLGHKESMRLSSVHRTAEKVLNL